jgi:hypothetical protein
MSRVKENYTGKDVCNSQDDFNVAMNKAIKNKTKQDIKQAGGWLYVYVLVHMIFLIWALILAMQINKGPERIIHLVFAIVFSPAYVIAHYLCFFKGGDKSSSSSKSSVPRSSLPRTSLNMRA